MAQVAAGLIAPETAAYQVVRQVGEDLGTPNTQQQQQSTADQLIHELASPADVLREGQGVSGDGSAQDDAFKVNIPPACSNSLADLSADHTLVKSSKLTQDAELLSRTD